ncbi:MAG: Aminopyrrolnitrin oxygenase PrnD [Candidatus Accumulibacter phosphatis]|uniref:Aminopyrrolnitrin oxygenase PrnD n=1 Tax=Candidatus Accumulibacter phosphatis TaxID=327160 RepID=A0A080MBU3_9PROT|nr:aromatic ring-hydroxylating dioxygenase subunit alpha [Accumulibacter sp.]KFB74599.1 MAG: Aminopyrrolnitrin oxygenase PrnD [Candidatus Accumulibacter phosphatis]HRF12484.1 aromatic ring-hydroxylating dioxygenase subunit alpha [Candidatus Accumulibacter phosphatis]
MDTRVFNHPEAVVQGWYWLARSREIRRGQVVSLRLLGRELAVYRGGDGRVAAFDAYCAHMGAHLAEGRVEGNALRCFFHRWRYEADGRCSDIPCLAGQARPQISVRCWPTAERYGMVWLWTGETPTDDLPEVPELAGKACDALVANRFRKRCHPNVVLINAIDEQHFASVHHLPGSILTMEAVPRSVSNIEFRNLGKVPTSKRLGRLLARFYQGPLTYTLSYWYGSLGTVTLGPDFLHLHLMFALRVGDDGSTEGQTLALTRQRRGPLGWLVNRLLLYGTALAARYFAWGDTRVFETIRFDFRHPIPADRAVLAFIRHLESQPLARWHEIDRTGARPRPTRMRLAGTDQESSDG